MDTNAQIEQIVASIDNGVVALQLAQDRIRELETALGRMVLAHENTSSDSEGAWPQPDHGCFYCTVGTVPDRLNTGLCAYHTAKKLLGQP